MVSLLFAASSSSSSLGAEPASIQWGGGGERKRRWGSGKQRSGSSTTNISSDILKVCESLMPPVLCRLVWFSMGVKGAVCLPAQGFKVEVV